MLLQVLGAGCVEKVKSKSDNREANKSSSGVAKLLALPTQNITNKANTRESGSKVSKDDKIIDVR